MAASSSMISAVSSVASVRSEATFPHTAGSSAGVLGVPAHRLRPAYPPPSAIPYVAPSATLGRSPVRAITFRNSAGCW
jgi:hypothetical protein